MAIVAFAEVIHKKADQAEHLAGKGPDILAVLKGIA